VVYWGQNPDGEEKMLEYNNIWLESAQNEERIKWFKKLLSGLNKKTLKKLLTLH
jgi:hypothetical protein